MQTFDFTPLYRSTVGFDRVLDLLDSAGTTQTGWPPHDIEKTGDNAYRITMAVAGFGKDEIEVVQQANVLVVTGRRDVRQDDRNWLHQGIAARNFKQTFNLADHVKVISADLENGLLSVDLIREVPEQLKPRRITIGASASPVSKLPAQAA